MASTQFKGEVGRVEPSFYFAKQYDGDHMRVHIDATTQTTGTNRPGDHSEANVNGQSHALLIRSAQ